jgi:hypothetical protein
MTKNFIFPGWSMKYQQIKNSVKHYRTNTTHRENKFSNWEYTWYSENEWNEKQFYNSHPHQSRLFPVVLPTDTKLIRERWDACILENCQSLPVCSKL